MTNARDDRLDVVIVGAGPTGLTLAGQLQTLGVSFPIVDRQPDRVHESRALAVQPRTLEVLRGLGVTRELLRRGNDALWLRRHAGGRSARVRLFGLGLADTAFPFLLFVSQAETEAVLIDRLAAGGAQVERNVELTGFSAAGDGVTCTLRHRDGRTEEVAARYLAGCDGAGSAVRRGAGIPFQVAPIPRPSPWPTWRSTAAWRPTPPTASSAATASCSASRWAGPRPGGSWSCIPACRRRSRPGRPWRRCRRSPAPSPAAGCGSATRSG